MKIKSLCFKSRDEWFVFCSKCGINAVWSKRNTPVDPSALGRWALESLVRHSDHCYEDGENMMIPIFFGLFSLIKERK